MHTKIGAKNIFILKKLHIYFHYKVQKKYFCFVKYYGCKSIGNKNSRDCAL